MKRRIFGCLLGITLSLTMLFSLLPACGGAPESGGTAVPAAVQAGEPVTWRWQSMGNAGTATYWIQQEFAENVTKASGGRLIIDLQPQGAIVGTYEIFDAFSTGAIESGTS